MDDPGRDTQDSETSSEGSWILLSSDQAAADLASVEVNTNSTINSLQEVVQKLADVDMKNYHSDIESDGISIISESDFSQSSESDDENNTLSKSEKYEDGKDLLIKTGQFMNEELEDIEEGYDNVSRIHNSNDLEHEDKCTNIENCSSYLVEKKTVDMEVTEELHLVNIENCSLYLVEKKTVDMEVTEELHTVNESIKRENTENLPSQIQDELKEQTLIYDSLKNAILKCELKKMITLPSFLCTSVVIFAVLIFPFFSSKVDNTNNLDQPDVEEYDEYSLSANKIAVVDPLVYCMEIQKNEDLYHEYNINKCVKQVLQQMKKIEKNYNKAIDEIKKKSNSNVNSDKVHMKKKDFDQTDKNYESKNKHKSRDKAITKIFLDNEILKASNADVGVAYMNENDHKDSTFMHDLPNVNENHIADYWNFQQEHEDSNNNKKTDLGKEKLSELKKELNKMKKFLLEKENFLMEWEEQLTERELKIQKNMKKSHIKEHKGETNFFKKTKHEKKRKRKGDFDKDDDLHERKFEKNKKQKKDEFVFEKRKKQGKHLEDTHKKKDEHKFNEDDYEEKWRDNKNVLRMKGAFHSKNSKKNIERKDAPSRLFWKNINKESSNKVNINSQDNTSKYLKVNYIVKKNRTRISDDDNITVTGEWYLSLVQGRNDIRKKEGKALWWFDRVELRKNKRNKAFWYFQYMINRENLRYRQKNI